MKVKDFNYFKVMKQVTKEFDSVVFTPDLEKYSLVDLVADEKEKPESNIRVYNSAGKEPD